MVMIVASLPGGNLFSSLPSNPPPTEPTFTKASPSPPIPIPKYPPPRRFQKTLKHPPEQPSKPSSSSPALKYHRNSKYYKPVNDGVISSEGDRAVVIGESGVSYLLPGAPFEFQYSYSETPKVKPLAIREPAFLPFAPPTMPRPWTGKAPLKSSKNKKKIPLVDSHDLPPPGALGVKQVEIRGPIPLGKYPKEEKTREEILGKPLKKWEIRMLVKPMLGDNRQVNLGRDGLTHNMLELIHSHWKRSRVCKVRCKGVPTVDMDNVCHHLEEKTGGKIIHRVGGVVYLFCGRNYDYRTRPQYPVMLWKPAAPVYPKLIQEAPEGLTKAEADRFRKKGKKLLPICKLSKNGVYTSLVNDVRHAFEGSPLVKIDCTGLDPSDYKKIGAKLKELVPCVLLSFDDEQILMWRGKDWKSMYPEATPVLSLPKVGMAGNLDGSGDTDNDQSEPDSNITCTSPKMMSLWKRAIESSKAVLLDDINVGPDALLEKVEEFERISQATEHSYPAFISSSEDGAKDSINTDFEDTYSSNDFTAEDDDDDYEFEEYDDYDEDGSSNDVVDSLAPPPGSLPIDSITEKLRRKQDFK